MTVFVLLPVVLEYIACLSFLFCSRIFHHPPLKNPANISAPAFSATPRGHNWSGF